MPGIFAAGPVWEQRIFENPVGPSCRLTKPLHPEGKKIARSPGKLGSKGNFQRQREKVWSIQGRAGHPRTWPGFCAKKSRKVYNSGQLAVFEWVLWVQPCTPYGPLGLVLYLRTTSRRTRRFRFKSVEDPGPTAEFVGFFSDFRGFQS